MNQEHQHLLNEQIKTTLIKLEKDIDFHRMDRQYHMRRTNFMVKLGVALLIVLGVFNVLYLWDFYIRMQEIVYTITDLGTDVVVVSNHMVSLTETLQKFDTHMAHMPSITNATISMADRMPTMNLAMQQMQSNLGAMNSDISVMRADAVAINQRFANITQGVNMMGHNVNAISGPMGVFNPFMP